MVATLQPLQPLPESCVETVATPSRTTNREKLNIKSMLIVWLAKTPSHNDSEKPDLLGPPYIFIEFLVIEFLQLRLVVCKLNFL